MLCPVNRAGSYQDCFRGFGENQVQWTGAKVGIILWSYFSICPGFFFCSNPKKRNYSRLEIMTVGKACTQGYIPTPGVTSGQVICTFEKSRSRSRKKWPTVVASLMLCSVQYCLLSCWEHATLIVWICRPTVTLHQGQGHQNEHIGHP